ncbi:sciellin [Lampris incognitus]|uniref:sciellin n=1 Tax=Lampris incognitus TaxID=2546036 RepID=UPI0024B61932|nr:sciellin [Lampris incognitus]
MSFPAARRSYASKSSSPSQAIEDRRKKSSVLKDNSWIKRDSDEDEPVDRDPNFGKSVLSGYRPNENLKSTEPETTKSRKTTSSFTSVQALTKRFSTSQDELNKSSTLPSSQRTTSYTRRSTTPKTAVKEEPKSSVTTTTTTETNTTTQSVSRSPVIKTPTKTDTFTERVFSDVKCSSKGTPYSPLSPSKTTKVTETTVTSKQEAEEQLHNKLTPKSKDDFSITDSKTAVPETETVTVKSYTDGDGIKTTTTTRTSSTAEKELYDPFRPKSGRSSVSSPVSTTRVTSREVFTSSSGDDSKTTTPTRTSSTTEDELYDSLLPKSIRSDLSSPTSTRSFTESQDVTVDRAGSRDGQTLSSPTSPRTITSDDYTSTRRSFSRRPDSSYEYTSVTSPTVSTTTPNKDSRMVLEKDLCTHCRKPFNSEAKMVMEDMKINCHASCFKCEVCNTNLGSLKAGDSMWIYRRTVHCENCFDITREKWRR